MNRITKYFSFEGRTRRRDYWISAFTAPVVVALLSLLFAQLSYAGLFLALIAIIALFWFEIAEGTRRCHDLGHRGWWQLIPFYGLWMMFKAGNEGTNEYGPDPKLTQERPLPQFEAEMLAIQQERGGGL